MTQKTLTSVEITCDVCAQITPQDYSTVVVQVTRTTDVCDVFVAKLSGEIGYGGSIKDLCRDCATEQLRKALTSIERAI